ncbi:carbamoyltransferase family protein [Pseudomonas mangiferae]|uniref:carbamoyltransferase family protein n=1 Tax=Pseudomonas mangiferae TaxID=2593654 RepID=UPI0015B62726|nr:carbamoyltransferase C-terminal domain-containing protein [Pseudomonas mangiferae]
MSDSSGGGRTYYLGLSTSGHDPALALLDDGGQVLFAEATERFLQDKRAWGAAPDHPGHLAAVLAAHCEAGARVVVATSWTRLKAELPTDTMDNLLPAAEGAWLRTQQKRAHADAGDSLARLLPAGVAHERRDFDHHLCHAAYACHGAPFDAATCLVLDGEGEVGAVSLYRYRDGRLARTWRSWGPGSLGTYYGWLTGACGFDWKAGEEWKVMGLAAFGTPRPELLDALSQMLHIEAGRPRLPEPDRLLALMARLAPARRAPSAPLMTAADLAASGQAAYAGFADAVLAACASDGQENLVLTGGCALNSSYNGSLAGRHGFRAVHVPSAPGDDGNAVGAALLAWMQDHPGQPLPRARQGAAGSAYLGSRPDPAVIAAVACHAGGFRVRDLGAGSAGYLAERLAAGRIVGVMRGAAEYGPRALGHRSILADPRPAAMKDRINRQVKGREPYRPFAPMLPAERVGDWFQRDQASPYMSFALPWREARREQVPAVVHADGSGRLQTVGADEEPWLRALLAAFEARSGVPILLNTSFNVMGKPIVHSVQDALAVLATTGLDAVLLEDLLVEKDAP